jgi:hypothetical protein
VLIRQCNPALADLDLQAIIARAEAARPGHKVSLEIPKDAHGLEDKLWGYMNLLLPVVFEDGGQWLFKVSTYGDPQGEAPMLMRMRHSEVLVHHLLLEHGIPVPRIVDWGAGACSKSGSE